MNRVVRILVATVACAALAAIVAGVARADGAMIVRFGPEAGCQFGPTDVPGVPVAIPGDCLVVATPSGNATVVVRGRIPAGFTLPETFVDGDVPCGFPGLGFGRGVLTATRSGQVTAHCHIRPDSAGGDLLAALHGR